MSFFKGDTIEKEKPKEDVRPEATEEVKKLPPEIEIVTFLKPFGPGTQEKRGKLTATKNRKLKDPSTNLAVAALDKKDWDEVARLYNDTDTSEIAKARIRAAMLKPENCKILADNPEFGGDILSSVDPEALKDLDFKAFGKTRKKNDLVAAALLAIADKKPAKPGEDLDRETQLDPKLLTLLAGKIPTKTWNDTDPAIGAKKRGLAPQVCNALWQGGNYDALCGLIDSGVRTDTPFESQRKKKGVYSGFVQPVQHIVQKYMHEVPKLGTDKENTITEGSVDEVKGAQKVFAALDRKGNAATLTKWSDVTSCDMIKEFQKNPGTIWGFEDVRLPFVSAAHQTDQGKQPLRMMELWSAVSQTLNHDDYVKLLEQPDVQIPKIVNRSKAELKSKLQSGAKGWTGLSGSVDEFTAQFEKDAESFLREYATRMPKGTRNRQALGTAGQTRKTGEGLNDPTSLTVNDLTGIHWDKSITSFACEAGLWWAKKEKKPVYYCLDGVDMKDVTDYKRIKNKKIEQFLAEGGPTQSPKPFHEVVTLQELREVLKNWDELKDTIKFSVKGKMLEGDALEKQVKQWIKDMKEANEAAGRTPAPPKSQYKDDLDAIDPKLYARLQNAQTGGDDDETDMDARDIVRKSGYLLKIAGTQPDIVLKFLMAKCQVLVEYELIPADLPLAAAQFRTVAADTTATAKAVKTAGKALMKQLGKCPQQFRRPLSRALLGHELVQRSKSMRKTLEKNANK